ncbi:MAG TPA: flagellar biosynthesis anti-sigma factor FlgM [Stellaceae bacterium]|jgi:negative regulator of flagellin synthesis FlgM
MPDPINGVTANAPHISLGVGNAGQAGAAQAANDGAASQTAAPATDQADVGQTQALLAQIIQAANNAPGVDETKVNALQQAIQNGTYQVDPMTIAKKLMGLDSKPGEDGN